MNKYVRYLESLSKKSLSTVSLVLLVVVGVIDYVTGVELSFSILYLLPVALVTWYVSRRAGVTMGILCAIVWYLADFASSPTYSIPLVPYWNAVVMLCLFRVTVFLLSKLKQTIDSENRYAREIQQRLLPTKMPRIAGYEIAGAWRPAQSVSGDYYDVIEVRNAVSEQFGENRVLDTLKENHGRGANAACNGILEAVSAFSKGNYQDDIALLVISANASETIL
jgi:hypothetical protein